VQRDMRGEITPTIPLEYKARRALTFSRRKPITAALEINTRIVKPHGPNMDACFKRRQLSWSWCPGVHESATAEG